MSRSRARDRSRPSGRANRWSPSSLTGALQWYRGDGPATGSPVSAWSSLIGTADATQGTGASQPAAPTARAALNNQLALSFDGGDILGANSVGEDVDVSTGWTAVSVVEYGTRRNWCGLFRVSITENGGSVGADGFVIYSDSAGSIVVGSPDATAWFRQSSSSNLVVSNGAYALIATCSGSSASIAIELGTISGGSISWASVGLGALSGTFAMPSASGRFLFPGGGWSTASARFVGYVAEQILVNRAITASEIASLKSYLRRYA